MKTVLGILAIVVFIVGAWFMGSKFLDIRWDDYWDEKITAFLFGILLWLGVAFIVMICIAIFLGVSELLK